MEEELTSEPEVTREEALAMVAIIKRKMDVLNARYRTMREPDERLGDLPGPSQLRRTARRVRAGLYKPAWMTESAEELANEYDYAAEFIETEINLQRLTGRYRRMLEDVEDGFYDDVKDDFDDLKTRIRDFDAI